MLKILFSLVLIAVLVGITYGIQPYGGHTMGWTSPVVLGLMVRRREDPHRAGPVDRAGAHRGHRAGRFRQRQQDLQPFLLAPAPEPLGS